MTKADKLFHTVAITLLSILLVLLLFYFIFLPLYNRNKTNIYYEYKISGRWNGREDVDTYLPNELCSQDCFGEKNERSCNQYNEKYEMCEMECRGILCGTCSQGGFLNELRCFQLYSK